MQPDKQTHKTILETLHQNGLELNILRGPKGDYLKVSSLQMQMKWDLLEKQDWIWCKPCMLSKENLKLEGSKQLTNFRVFYLIK